MDGLIVRKFVALSMIGSCLFRANFGACWKFGRTKNTFDWCITIRSGFELMEIRSLRGFSFGTPVLFVWILCVEKSITGQLDERCSFCLKRVADRSISTLAGEMVFIEKLMFLLSTQNMWKTLRHHDFADKIEFMINWLSILFFQRQIRATPRCSVKIRTFKSKVTVLNQHRLYLAFGCFNISDYSWMGYLIFCLPKLFARFSAETNSSHQ